MIREKILYLLFRSLKFILEPMETALRRRIARSTGRLASIIPVIPTLTGKIRSEIFQNFAESTHDFFFPEDVRIHMPPAERLTFLENHPGGIVLLTFHAGAWELGAHFLSRLRRRTAAVYQPYVDPAFRDWIHSHRPKGVAYYKVGEGAAGQIIRALRNGAIVAMVGDKPYGEKGLLVRTGKGSMSWAAGPLVLAQKTGAIVVPTIVRRAASGEYHIEMTDPVDLASIPTAAQACADIYSDFIRRHPEQWARFDSFVPDGRDIVSSSIPAPNEVEFADSIRK